MRGTFLDDVVAPRAAAGDFFRITPTAVSADGQAWALTWLAANFVPALPPAQGPRFVFSNVTIWSAPSYEQAAAVIAEARAAAVTGINIRDSRAVPLPPAITAPPPSTPLPPAEESSQAWNGAAIAGVITAAVVLVAAPLLALFLYRRRAANRAWR